MKKSGRSIAWMIGITFILALGASGCATKKYVAKQVKPVDQRVSALDNKTSEQIAFLTNKEQADVSRLDERISTTDSRVTEVASVAQQASAAADSGESTGRS
jgi:hypothetical protein